MLTGATPDHHHGVPLPGRTRAGAVRPWALEQRAQSAGPGRAARWQSILSDLRSQGWDSELFAAVDAVRHGWRATALRVGPKYTEEEAERTFRLFRLVESSCIASPSSATRTALRWFDPAVRSANERRRRRVRKPISRGRSSSARRRGTSPVGLRRPRRWIGASSLLSGRCCWIRDAQRSLERSSIARASEHRWGC
jgi:hypothetical protein